VYTYVTKVYKLSGTNGGNLADDRRILGKSGPVSGSEERIKAGQRTELA
jgi:hypothetical protein